ncbi:MAG: sn-glycerol-3-phosphate ABC transporter ATP-binding protein UgpC [Pseudomonadota bacterium]
MAIVEYRNISKSFGAVRVIEGLNLTLEDRQFTVLLGPSGCGKTTLLRMTAGLETISGGDLLVDGQRMNEMHPRERDIAMVFQNYALYPTMPVWENIGFSLEVKGLPKAEIRRQVEEAAKVLNLSDHLDRYPRELSGGQRQRVAMGRAMVREAKLFLFDEPLSNLDAKLRAQMRVEIRQLHDRLGTTTIYVTHDQIEAMTMADRIVLMKGGAIEQQGTPDELFDRPASIYAADFIGTPAINFVHGSVEDGAFRADGLALPLPNGAGMAAGHGVTCGLRPSDLTIAEDGPIAGKVVLTEKTGVEQNVHLAVAGEDFVVTAPRDLILQPGQPLRVDLPPSKIHLFDRETGTRL